MMTVMPSICFAYDSADTLLINRIWDYKRNFSQPIEGLQKNIYMRYSFNTERRNPTLFLVPTMYVIAKDERLYIGESYCKVKFREVDDYSIKRQVVYGTIPRQRITMPTLLELTTPDLYDMTIYPNHMLSPFHRSNRQYYKYTIKHYEKELATVSFQPRVKNTQLVSGFAVVNAHTGQIKSVQFQGDYDMLTFMVSALMNTNEPHVLLPERCYTTATFRFLGNRIKANFLSVYNCETTLPDSVEERVDKSLMEQLRPIPLNPKEKAIYTKHEDYRREQLAKEKADTTAADENWKWMKKVGWDIIGNNLVNSHNSSSKHFSVHISPLLNPLYLGYSQSHGFSYKLNIGFRYAWNDYRYLTLNPQLGYNFKKKQIYYTVPLRMTYNPKRNGYAEIILANGNHISNSFLADDFHKSLGPDVAMPDYRDQYVKAVNNVEAFDWLEIMVGAIHHRRIAVDRTLMRDAGLQDEIRSFAPLLTLRFSPWRKGPVLTANYERSFNTLFHSDQKYERWEFDASFSHRMRSLRILNMRAGTGFYTLKNSKYFVDYDNFRDENLPTGWEDDWSGQFQLLKSSWYNESYYYIRGHVSYDSPMIILYRLPLFGRLIETERLYVSALSIEHTRPYFEVGYGFSNRYFSTAFFTSFLNTKIQDVGFKFTIQLFNRW